MKLAVVGLSRIAAALPACGFLAQPISAQDGPGAAASLELVHDGEVRAVLQRLTPDADTVHVAPPTDVTEAERLAQQVVIYRDRYVVPHVRGRTDEAAIFGLVYARAEDQFELVEQIFINRLGRAGEVHGEEGLLSHDLARGRDLLVHAYRYRDEAREAWDRLPAKLRALIEAYGNSTDPDSPHYEDQAAMFARGRMKPVLFEMEDILANLEEEVPSGRARPLTSR